MHRVLVTGANGFIGGALCERVHVEGWYVRGTIRSLKYLDELPEGIDIVETDSIDAHTNWEKALEDIDTVVHLASKGHIVKDATADSLSAFRRINVTGTEHLARLAALKGIKRFIYLSSVKVNGEGKPISYTEKDTPAPSDPYSISKYEAEQVLQQIAGDTDLEIVVLRPPLVYGPGVKANFLTLLRIVNDGYWLPLASVKNRRSLIFLDNMIEAILAGICHPDAAGKTYLVSDGDDVSTPELIRRIAKAMEKSTKLLPFPPVLLRHASRLAGKSSVAHRLLNSLYVDISKIQTELDWSPRFSMKVGLSKTTKWFLKEFQ